MSTLASNLGRSERGSEFRVPSSEGFCTPSQPARVLRRATLTSGARRRAWCLIGVLAALDLAVLAAIGPGGGGSSLDAVQRALVWRVERQHALNSEFQGEVMHALLYRTDQPNGTLPPPLCRQRELTYGDIDPCGR